MLSDRNQAPMTHLNTLDPPPGINPVITSVTGPVAYIVKRYPRLTETFILNEILAMERLGADLHIVSLLPLQPPPHHPMVAEIAARIHAPIAEGRAKWAIFARAHGTVIAHAPHRYLWALASACLRSVLSPTPPTVWKQFNRAVFVAATCQRHGIRHIHAHFANAPTAVARFASQLAGIPFSFTAHAKDLYLTPRRAIQRRAHKATFIATCTSYNVSYLKELLGNNTDKIQLVYHGVDLGLFGARSGATTIDAARTGAPPLILSVGRLVPKKGFDDLIAACSLLHKSGVDFRCRIVGEGPLRGALQDQIAASGLTGIVTLEGSMTHAMLIALYGRADLFALAPRIAEDGDRDGIPNVITEAMASGVPVVSTDVSGIPEMVRNEQTGLLTPPHDPPALAMAMRSLLRDRPKAERLAAAGRGLLEQDFNLWTTTRKLHTMIGCAACWDESLVLLKSARIGFQPLDPDAQAAYAERLRRLRGKLAAALGIGKKQRRRTDAPASVASEP